jgi:glycosyltransferase involved in cell wall biosynthesis
LTALLPELARRGHEVTMYCRMGDVERGGDFEGVRRIWLPAFRTKQAATLSHGALAAITCRARRHDVVLAVNVANSPYCGIARWTGQPVALNLDGQEWLRGKWSKLGRAFFRGCARLARHAATAPISDSAAMAEIYLREFGTRSTVIPYFHEGTSGASDTSPLDRRGLAPYQYFVIAGRHVPENNIHRIVATYARLRATLPLLVLGTANYDSPVTRQIHEVAQHSPNVRLIGHLNDRQEFGTLLRYARRYLHGHSVGGINPSLVEALGVGAHVLALDTPFNREAAGGTGDYFTDFDDSLDAALVAAFATDTADLVLRDSAIERASTKYSLHDVADAYEDLLSNMANSGSFRTITASTHWTDG